MQLQKPKTITFGPAAPLNQLHTHPSDMDQQKQNALAESMDPGYPKVIEETSQMVGSLKTPKDGRMQNEINLKVDLDVSKVGLSDQGPRIMTMVQDSWYDQDPVWPQVKGQYLIIRFHRRMSL